MQPKSSRRLIHLILSLVLASILVFGSVGQASAAAVIYVKSTATGANNGTSWVNAYKSLQTALAHAAVGSGTQIWVAKGTYKPTTGTCTITNTEAKRKTSFVLKNGVGIYGGFAGNETLLSQRKPSKNVTYLNGDICVLGSATDNSYHVVVGGTSAKPTDRSAILDGLTIKNGNANGAIYSGQPRSGGGIFIVNSSPTLRNLVFTLNAAADIGGGGMYNEGSSPKLTNITFKSNSANNLGGGMYNLNSNPVLTKVRFISNSTGNPGGAGMYNNNSSPKLTNVSFTTNTAGAEGGGIYNSNGSNPTLSKVTFSGNSATTGGGMSNESSSPKLTNVIFSNNHSTGSGQGGGGMFNNNTSEPTLNIVTFSGNTTLGSGGGMYNNSGSDPSLTNVTFSANQASIGGGLANQSSGPTLNNVTFNGNTATTSASGDGMYNADSTPLIKNSIFWGDNGGAAEIVNSTSTLTINDSIIQNAASATDCLSDGQATCTNVLAANPELGILQKNGGYTKTMALGVGSGAIDAGGANSPCAAKDQRGVVRPQGLACDIGAYEVKAMSFTSAGGYDGQVLESGANTGVGGSANSTATSIKVGDDGSNRQVRAILSFNTSTLPDTAIVVLARPRVKQTTAPTGDPFGGSLGNLTADLQKPYFGIGLALLPGDFQSTGAAAGKLNSTPTSGWYTGRLGGGLENVSLTGTTQLRLRFSTANNNNGLPDYLPFYSGNAGTTSNWPILIVYYNP